MHTTELLSVLYELSLTNLKHLKPKDTAESFVKKFISRKSLNAGSVWTIEGVEKEEMKLKNIYATPVTSKKAFINATHFRKLFGKENFIVTQESIISSRNMQGSYAYFKLNDFGLLELFYNGKRDSFTREGFLPFEDVIAQFAISLESGFFNQKLQEEIDNRVAAEKQLKTNESKYRRIIDNIKLGLLEVDNNEIIRHANTAFLESTGYELEELIGKKASDALLDEESKKTIAAQNKARKKGESGSYEAKIKDKNGNDKWFIISGAPNYDKSGNIIGSIGIHLDITDEKISGK